ncbi:MAG TPA: hypothetical protein VFC60_03200 [Tissierellaceae bacterium]|nr:hypothetical protein [Tissierellaceae bacterium]
MDKLYINQKLKTAKGEIVEIVDIKDDKITVLFNGKKHSRHRSIIGYKLFVINEDQDTNEILNRTCDDCFILKKGDCFGRKEICEDFKYVASVSKGYYESWPKYCDASMWRVNYERKRK